MQGTAVIRFIIDKNSRARNFEIAKDLCEVCGGRVIAHGKTLD